MTRLPYDELDLFSNEEYHEFVGETLLLSTVVYEYLTGEQRTRTLIITKKRLYLLQKNIILHAVEMNWIIGLVQSQQHPEIVLLLVAEQDDLRLATTTDERCEAIKQALGYVFTRFVKKELNSYTLNERNLKAVEETKEVKMKRKKLELSPVLRGKTAEVMKYVEPEDQEPREKTLYTCTGERISLSKVFFKEKLAEGTTFKSYICKVDLNPGICFVYERTAFTGNNLQKHVLIKLTQQNSQFINKLLFAIQTQHKIFIIYEYMRHRQRIDQQYLAMAALTLLKSTQWFRQNHIPYPLICKTNIIFGQEKVLWRQFRYISPCDQFQKLVYTAPEALLFEDQTQLNTFPVDIYSLGVLLYQIVFSITPFLHRDPEIMMRFKMMNRILFPKYMHVTIMSEFLKDFIFKCTNSDPEKRFKTIEEVSVHPWLN